MKDELTEHLNSDELFKAISKVCDILKINFKKNDFLRFEIKYSDRETDPIKYDHDLYVFSLDHNRIDYLCYTKFKEVDYLSASKTISCFPTSKE